MVTEKDIIDAYCKIREIDNTIPDEVLDFMKESSLRVLQNNSSIVGSDWWIKCCENYFGYKQR